MPPESLPAGSAVPVEVIWRPECVAMSFRLRGGGRLDPEPDPDSGRARTTWTLGPLPILNALALPGQQVLVDATLATPIVPEPFGEVDAFLAVEGVAGSTEGLAFDPARDRIVMGVPGGLIQVDAAGKVGRVAVTGDPLVAPLGLAFAPDGTLWVADGQGAAVRKVTPAGEVVTVAGAGRQVEPVFPNSVAVERDGGVVFTDTCGGRVWWLDPSGTPRGQAGFWAKLTGGPNGVAIDSRGDCWVTTENTALLCMDGTDPAARVAGLFRVSMDGAKDSFADGVGHYGDGIAVDSEDNLYAVFDALDGLALEESAVFVLPNGRRDIRKVMATTDRLMANPAFGRGAFGETTMYVALIAIPPITDPSARGLVRAVVGMKGL
jgi:sugar lactone lactonase YvrE